MDFHVTKTFWLHLYCIPKRFGSQEKVSLLIDKSYGELYDLAADPDEVDNLYDEPGSQSIRQDLEAGLFTWLAHSTYHNSGYKNQADPMYRVRTNDMIDFD